MPRGSSFSLSAIGIGKPVLARLCPLPGWEDSLVAVASDGWFTSLADLLLRDVAAIDPGCIVELEASGTG